MNKLFVMIIVTLTSLLTSAKSLTSKRVCFETKGLYFESSLDLPNGDTVFTMPRVLAEGEYGIIQYIDKASNPDDICKHLFQFKRSVQSWSDFGVGALKILIKENGDFEFVEYPMKDDSNLSPIISKIVCSNR